MSKTVKEWFSEFHDPMIREKLLRVLKRSDVGAMPDTAVVAMYEALSRGFTWSSTDDGHVYWDNVYRMCKEAEMKTVKQWFSDYPDTPIRHKLLRILKRGDVCAKPDMKCSSMRQALQDGFTWSETDDGTDYWRGIVDNCQ